jgi:uncharacterized protein YggU (UPF0235/DUF167 family)
MPANRRFEITDARRGAALTVHVVTQSDRSEIAGLHEDGVLKVRLRAQSAGDPAANKELLDVLAARLGIAVSLLEIVAGANGREKLVTIEGLTGAQVEELLANPRL